MKSDEIYDRRLDVTQPLDNVLSPSNDTIRGRNKRKSRKVKRRRGYMVRSDTARVSKPKLANVNVHSYWQPFRSRVVRPLEPISEEDATIGGWQELHVCQQPALVPLEMMSNAIFDDVTLDAAEPQEHSRKALNAAAVDRVTLHASRLPALRKEGRSLGPSGSKNSSHTDGRLKRSNTTIPEVMHHRNSSDVSDSMKDFDL